MASSMVFLGLSIILFVIVYAILYQVAPAILGVIFTEFGNVAHSDAVNSEWAGTYDTIDQTTRYLLPFMMTLGLVVLVIKALMAAGARGND